MSFIETEIWMGRNQSWFNPWYWIECFAVIAAFLPYSSLLKSRPLLTCVTIDWKKRRGLNLSGRQLTQWLVNVESWWPDQCSVDKCEGETLIGASTWSSFLGRQLFILAINDKQKRKGWNCIDMWKLCPSLYPDSFAH